MKNMEEKLHESHDATMKFVYEQMAKTDPQMVASTMLAIAMRLYKTILTKDDFQMFVDTVASEADRVEPFNRPSIN
jgi:hypothetical protein